MPSPSLIPLLDQVTLSTVIAAILIACITMAYMVHPDVSMTRPFRNIAREDARTPWDPPPPTTASKAASVTGKDEHGGHLPSPDEIVDLRTTLVRAKKLPADIVDEIFNYAEYWACSSNEMDYMKEHGDTMKVNGRSRCEDKFLLRSFPVGLTGLTQRMNLAEELAYDTNLPQPAPLEKEHESDFFAGLADYPTPTLTSPVRKIVFNLRCRDQGSGGQTRDRGTFNGSWTWLDAGLERFDASKECDSQCVYDLRYQSRESQTPKLPLCSLRPIQPRIDPASPGPEEEGGDRGPSYRYVHELAPPANLTIQKNRVATRELGDYTIVWRYDDDVSDPESDEAKALGEAGRGLLSGNGEFVRGLKFGDVVTIWAKSRFPAWVNYIERVSIDIYWAV